MHPEPDTILKGVWGGTWKYLGFKRDAKNAVILYAVTSMRTGYTTQMLERSFKL